MGMKYRFIQINGIWVIQRIEDGKIVGIKE